MTDAVFWWPMQNMNWRMLIIPIIAMVMIENHRWYNDSFENCPVHFAMEQNLSGVHDIGKTQSIYWNKVKGCAHFFPSFIQDVRQYSRFPGDSYTFRRRKPPIHPTIQDSTSICCIFFYASIMELSQPRTFIIGICILIVYKPFGTPYLLCRPAFCLNHEYSYDAMVPFIFGRSFFRSQYFHSMR